MVFPSRSSIPPPIPRPAMGPPKFAGSTAGSGAPGGRAATGTPLPDRATEHSDRFERVVAYPPPEVLGSANCGNAAESQLGMRRLASGFVSFVVHAMVLLVLAFIATPRHNARPVAIVIDTAAHGEQVDFEDVPVELPVVEREFDTPDPDAVVDIPLDPIEDLPALIDDLQPTDPAPVEFTVTVNEADLMVRMAAAPALDRPLEVAAASGRRGGDPLGGLGLGRGGFDGEVGRRLAVAGARTGDVQVSLAWNNVNDLDLHVVTPFGERIFFGHRLSHCGGCLDVDMNVVPATPQAVENVFWPPARGPRGDYIVFVHHYRQHVRFDPTPFEVHVLVRGRKAVFPGVVAAGQGPVLVTRFNLDGTGLPLEGHRSDLAETPND
jgi:hypothetical protein